ncbi:MAG TPA: outer membrane protein transport protein, partial [Polyangiaceae bacterium]|nr:outer membrane protein transport protein [Polyangiaceae bacterium]
FLDDRLRFSLTWRGELQSSLRGANTVQINGFQGTPQYPFSQPMNIVAEHAPHQLNLSAAWAQGSFAAALDTTWSQWSGYRDDTDRIAGFHDTLSVAAGVEGRLAKRSLVRGGIGYRPSPVPEQTGRTNYADNSMWVFGLGLSQEVMIAGMTLDVSAFGQLQAAVPRSHTKAFSSSSPACADGVAALCDEIPDDTKDPATGKTMPEAQGLQTGNPGFPGWSSGGWIAAAGVQVSWRYR